MPGQKEKILRDRFLLLRNLRLPGYLVNRQVKITSTGWIYLGLILFFGFASINTGNNLLYLILSVMISLLVASFLLSEMAITELLISRKIPEAVYAHEPFSIIYQVQNQRRFFPSAGIEIMETINGLQAKAYLLILKPKTTYPGFVPITLKSRGRVKFNQLLIRTRFPFGFFEKTKKAKIPKELIVLPKPFLQELPFSSSLVKSGVFNYPKKGYGSELFGFRPYLAGDHPHWIDWKASAKTAQILVQETEQDAEHSLAIILNISLIRPVPDSFTREKLISQGFGLAKFYIEKGYRVRVQVQNVGIDFGAGLNHLKKIAYFLALFDDPNENFQKEKLSSLNDSCQKIFLAE